MAIPTTYQFTRYLAAKKSVDDRALNRHVWHSLAQAMSPAVRMDLCRYWKSAPALAPWWNGWWNGGCCVRRPTPPSMLTPKRSLKAASTYQHG